MENATYHRTTEIMGLLKGMVLLCISCVIVTAFGEYRRMRKLDEVIDLVRKSCSPGRKLLRSSSSSVASQPEHSDITVRTPTP